MFKDCHLGPGRGLIQAVQTWLSPGAPLLMLTKAAHGESLHGHGAMLWSPGGCAVLENRLQAWQQRVDGVPGLWWRHTNWARGHSWGRSRRGIYLVADILRNTTSNSQLILGGLEQEKICIQTHCFWISLASVLKERDKCIENFFSYSSSACFGIVI